MIKSWGFGVLALFAYCIYLVGKGIYFWASEDCGEY